MIECIGNDSYIIAPRIVPEYKLEDRVYFMANGILYEGTIIGYKLNVEYNLSKHESYTIKYIIAGPNGRVYSAKSNIIIAKIEHLDYPGSCIKNIDIQNAKCNNSREVGDWEE